MVITFNNYFAEKPKDPGFKTSRYQIMKYLSEEEKIDNMIKNHFLLWDLDEATRFYHEMKPSYMIIKIKDGRQFMIQSPEDIGKLSRYPVKTKIEKISFNGINDKLGINPKYHIKNIRARLITESEVVNYKTTKSVEHVFDMDYNFGHISEPKYKYDPDKVINEVQEETKTHIEISFESDELNLDNLGIYAKYSFKELKEYLAYLTIEVIVKNTQKTAEIPLSREEIIGLIKEYYMYEEEYDSSRDYREGDDFQHRDISVTKVIVHTEEFPSYRETRDGHLYQMLHLVDKERAAVLFKQDEYEPYISYSNRIKVVPLKSIQKDDFEFEEQDLEEDNEMER